MNNSIVVNFDSLEKFYLSTEESFNNIINALSVMYDKTIENEDMINSKTGNLFNEVMLEQLINEKNSLTNDSEHLLSLIRSIYNEYKTFQESNHKSVGDIDE